jgi:predicted phosphodiesterase
VKIALLADIHGNYRALQAVLDDVRRQQPDRIIVLGDIVFKGPEPELCVAAVMRLAEQADCPVSVIRGNIDELVGHNAIQPGFAQNEAHEQALRAEMAWTRSRLSAAQLAYLRELPFMMECELPTINETKRWLRAVHATPQSILTAILPTDSEARLEELFAPPTQGEHEHHTPDIVAYAHIHLPYARYFNGRLLFNTGSVGLPFDGDARASYAVLFISPDSGAQSLDLRRIPYDVEQSVAAYRGSGHPDAESVIRALRAGRKPL